MPWPKGRRPGPFKGRAHSSATCHKLSESTKKSWEVGAYSGVGEKISRAFLGKSKTASHRESLRKCWTPQRRRNKSRENKALWADSDHRASRLQNMRIGCSRRGREWVSAVRRAVSSKPNSVEQRLQVLLESWFPGEWRYNNGWFVTENNRVPDFVHRDGNQLIELFGDYWHTQPGMFQSDHARLLQFSLLGFDTFVVWEHEVALPTLLERRLRLWHNPRL